MQKRFLGGGYSRMAYLEVGDSRIHSNPSWNKIKLCQIRKNVRIIQKTISRRVNGVPRHLLWKRP